MLPDEPLGVVDEELLDGVDEVSLLVDELDVAGGVAGVVDVVLLLLLEGAGGVTVVVRSSLRSQPATPMPSAMASVLANNSLDFMGTPFRFISGD
jgi:hypothetical protein